VHAPDRERVRRVPARDVHGVVREHELPEVLGRPRVEREVGRLGPPGERLVERDQQPLGIAGGRRHEQDAGSFREVEHEVVEACPEGKASDRKDPTRHAGEYRIGCRLFAPASRGRAMVDVTLPSRAEGVDVGAESTGLDEARVIRRRTERAQGRDACPRPTHETPARSVSWRTAHGTVAPPAPRRRRAESATRGRLCRRPER